MAGIHRLIVTINRQLCLGDGVCCDRAGATFELRDDGTVYVRSDSQDDRDTIVAAARSCRMDAITVIDGETGEQLAPCTQETALVDRSGRADRTGT